MFQRMIRRLIGRLPVQDIGDGRGNTFFNRYTLLKMRWGSLYPWGVGGTLRGQDRKILAHLRQFCVPLCLKLTKDGHPQHPLYLPAHSEPFEMPEVAGA